MSTPFSKLFPKKAANHCGSKKRFFDKAAFRVAFFVDFPIYNGHYTPTPALLGGKKITLQPGQLTTGLKQLSVRSKIEIHKVDRILKALENEKLIEQRTTNKNRLISILLEHSFEESEKQTEKPVRNERETNEKPVRTLEEIKNIRNKEVMAAKPPNPTKKEFSPPIEIRWFVIDENIKPFAFLGF